MGRAASGHTRRAQLAAAPSGRTRRAQLAAVPSGRSRRAQLAAAAVVSAYLNEISRPPSPVHQVRTHLRSG